MKYSPSFRLFPTTEQCEAMDWTRNTVRQLYNHVLREFDQIPEDAGTLRQCVWMIRDTLPALKDWWTDLTQVYSTVLQKAVERIRDNIQNLGKLKANGYDVGSLNWKKPREYRSFTYRQSGFELDIKSGPNGRGLLRLKKLNGEPANSRFASIATFSTTTQSKKSPSRKSPRACGTPVSASVLKNPTNPPSKISTPQIP